MEKQILEIVKGKDDYAFKVEIKENAKGELSVAVTVRSDVSAKAASDEAIRSYKATVKELEKK